MNNRSKTIKSVSVKKQKGNSSNVTKKHSKKFVKCQQWLLEQKKLKTKLIPVNIDDEFPDTSSYPRIEQPESLSATDSEV